MNINRLCDLAHQNAKVHGWWEEDRSFGEQIALMHSELSEALEDFRNGRDMKEVYFEKETKPCGIPVELADVVIRIFDTCGRYGIDLQEAITIKMEYNKSRPYKHGGKII
jgi:NTP pyrophosphatase (non-canonical NTP hydrolase)